MLEECKALCIMDEPLRIKMTKEMEELHMDKAITYTVEREFLNKITAEELIRRIIQLHQEETRKKAV